MSKINPEDTVQIKYNTLLSLFTWVEWDQSLKYPHLKIPKQNEVEMKNKDHVTMLEDEADNFIWEIFNKDMPELKTYLVSNYVERAYEFFGSPEVKELKTA